MADPCRAQSRADEARLKAKPVKSDERLEKALRELRRTNNQAVAAREAGVSPERFRRFLREQKLAERKGRAWEITDKRPRDMTALTTRGAIELKLPDFDTASLVGRHNAAVKGFADLIRKWCGLWWREFRRGNSTIQRLEST
jgi:hypothetical protein